MNPVPQIPDEEQDNFVEYIPGPIVRLEGGIEDHTIRPSRRPRRPENGQQTPGGPDLTDWLNRTFDD
jgi:hypothetical protein